jgi:hypothetical protein
VCMGDHLVVTLFGYPKETAGRLEGKVVPRMAGGLNLKGIVNSCCIACPKIAPKGLYVTGRSF